MRFKKGDLLTTRFRPGPKPVARVERVTRKGVVHCVNLVASQTMDEGAEFQFTQDENTFYVVHSRGGKVRSTGGFNLP